MIDKRLLQMAKNIKNSYEVLVRLHGFNKEVLILDSITHITPCELLNLMSIVRSSKKEICKLDIELL